MSQYNFNATKLRQLASSVSNVVASLHEYQPLSKQVAKVIVTLSTDKCTSAEVASAISRAVGGGQDVGFAPVLGSFRFIPGARSIALAGFVTRHAEIVTQEDERFKRMRPVTASIMLDTTDSTMWDIRKGADDQTFLVRAGEEDLSKLLQTASVRDVNAPRMAEIASTAASTPGEYVAYVDPVLGELCHGFVLTSDGVQVEIIKDDEEKPVTIGEDSIIEAAVLNGEDVQTAAALGIDRANFDSKSKASMSEYYKALYSYAPGYVEEIQKQIDAHAAV